MFMFIHVHVYVHVQNLGLKDFLKDISIFFIQDTLNKLKVTV